MLTYKFGFTFVFALLLLTPTYIYAQTPTQYDIGAPTLTTIYISPNGNDSNDGLTLETALQTLTAAWERIPMGQELAFSGYHILMQPGNYTPDGAPHYWESRYGTFENPIVIEAANGPNTVYLPNVNIYDSRYLYFININIETGSDTFHCELCDHILVRGSRFVGAEPETFNTQETVKFNQSQYVYFENNDIAGAWDNAVDFVAVQYGHFLGNRIHNAGDWCMYLKGGSAYFFVSGNEYYDCGAGGITAGQGTGFQFMTSPWIQYEAYDIKFVNNLIHDSSGAGVGVQGGYNILIAYNTMYRVGERSHLLEFGFGSRSCDGQPGDEGRERCDEYNTAGGWGNNVVSDGENYVRIPNKNVFVYNNIIHNPSGYRSQYQHLTVFAPYSGEHQANSNVPAPTRADDNLQIRGNIIWNGGADMLLGVEPSPDFPAGCQADNSTCNEAQLRADNAINTVEPQLTDPANGDYRPATGWAMTTYSIPDFTWDVLVPAGNLSNAIVPDSTAFISTALTDTQTSVQPIENLALTVVAFTPAPPMTVNVQPLPPGPVTIVALGDSLTQGDGDELERGGYPASLLDLVNGVRPGSTMTNFGQSGWNSDALIHGDQGIASQLDRAVEILNRATSQRQAALALVWIGSNDLFYLYEYNNPDAQGENDGLTHYAANLDTILSRLTATGARVVIAQLDDQSLRPVTQGMQAFTGISREEIAAMSQQVMRYNTVIVEKAAQYGAFTVDFYHTDIFTNPTTLHDDGNHPNAAGHDLSAQLWFAAIQPLLGM
jgi:lysophospholipase L1-like esterase